MRKIVIAYVPVLQQGYLSFFESHRDADCFFVLGDEFISEFRPLVKDIRRLKPEIIKLLVESLDIFRRVEILTPKWLITLSNHLGIEIIFPNDFVHRHLATRFPNSQLRFDPVFLMWDSANSTAKIDVAPSGVISSDDFQRQMMDVAETEAKKSSGWWRRVAALAVRNGEVLIAAHNIHVPTEYEPYFSGDARAWFSRGINIELTTDMHAEAVVVAQAASLGVSLFGADLYVTTLPCPPCSKLVAYCGIVRLFFRSGYTMLDGESIIKSQGIEIIQVI